MSPRFLTLDAVLATTPRTSRCSGVRTAATKACWSRRSRSRWRRAATSSSLHRDLFEMAAAYIFHVVQNHPFVDGNKRTGLLSAVIFLAANNIIVPEVPTMAVAEGRVSKAELAEALQRVVTDGLET